MPTPRRGQPIHAATAARWPALGFGGATCHYAVLVVDSPGQDFTVYCTKMWSCTEGPFSPTIVGSARRPLVCWGRRAGGRTLLPASLVAGGSLLVAKGIVGSQVRPCRGGKGRLCCLSGRAGVALLYSQQIGRCKPQNPQNPTLSVLQVVAQATSYLLQAKTAKLGLMALCTEAVLGPRPTYGASAECCSVRPFAGVA